MKPTLRRKPERAGIYNSDNENKLKIINFGHSIIITTSSAADEHFPKKTGQALLGKLGNFPVANIYLYFRISNSVLKFLHLAS